LYVSRGKRKDQYFARPAGKYLPLGNEEKAAKEKIPQLLALPPEDNTIWSMCERFIAHERELLAKGDKNALSERTIDDYESDLANHVLPKFGNLRPEEFTAGHAAQYLFKRAEGLDGMQPAPSRANREIAALASAFNFGMRRGLAEWNPCRGVPRNRETPRSRRLSATELNEFVAFAKGRGGASYLVALIGCCVALCGRPRAEILELPKSAMTDLGIVVPANRETAASRERLVLWSPTLRQLVLDAINVKRRVASIYIFANMEGRPYTDHGFGCLWRKLMHEYAPGGAASPEWFRPNDLHHLYENELNRHQAGICENDRPR
jgi:site-specific recombinase XerD